MGTFKIEITAVGGHGCSRDLGDAQTVEGCGKFNCPDCSARDLVDKLKHIGCDIKSATLTHWPGEAGQVLDDLRTGIRKGHF